MQATVGPTDAESAAAVARERPALREVVTVVVVAAIYIVLAAAAIRYSVDHKFNTDFRTHASNAALSDQLGIPYPHFLSYWVMTAPCGFCTNYRQVLGPLPVIVGILLGAKFVVSYAMLRDGIGFRVRNYGASMAGTALLTTVALLLGFTFSLSFPNLYRGQIPPNQWHNTTTMVVMPLALWTFWAACRYVREPSIRGAVWLTAAGLISAAAKPNFAMAFVPAFAVHVLLTRVDKRWKRAGIVAVGSIGVVLLGQYYYMYHSAKFAKLRDTALVIHHQPVQKLGLIFSPFGLWRDISPVIPLSIVSMLLFPALAVFARPEAARKSRELRLAWLTFGFALLAFVAFDETGRLARTANFRWGGIVAMYILFLMSAALLLEPRRNSEHRGRDIAAWVAFALHVAAGIIVLAVFARTHSYQWLHWSEVFKYWRHPPQFK